MHFRALQVDEAGDGKFLRRVIQRDIADLPEGEVLVKVEYSSLNYKDALSAAGNKGVTRHYPHTPGIDAVGVVISSSAPEFSPGDEVLAVSPELGVSSPGGFGQFIRVAASWLIPAPQGLSLREAMIFGTAGFTAALCVMELQSAGVRPDMGDVLVTGSTGGVGMMTVGILAREGYCVTAATGKMSLSSRLSELGASRVIDREEVNDSSGKPLLSGQWAGVVDTVGGNFLSTAVRSAKAGGVVTACGNASSPDLSLTVYPFILRGVRLIGIDATRTPKSERVRVWNKLGRAWKLDRLNELAREVDLEQLDPEIDRILRGEQAGRVVVRL
jgi:acrylyl-CoA reductase (NADPH)